LCAPWERVEALGKISASFSVVAVPRTIFAVKQLQSKQHRVQNKRNVTTLILWFGNQSTDSRLFSQDHLGGLVEPRIWPTAPKVPGVEHKRWMQSVSLSGVWTVTELKTTASSNCQYSVCGRCIFKV